MDDRLEEERLTTYASSEADVAPLADGSEITVTLEGFAESKLSSTQCGTLISGQAVWESAGVTREIN